MQGKDFDFSCSPTISYPALRIFLSTATHFLLSLGILDVTHCFQNNCVEPCKRLYIQAPVCYIEWFKDRYPSIKLPESLSNRHVLQTINGMQGGKDAGRSWYLLLKSILEDFGFKMCPAEPALFVFYDGSAALIVVTSTDDFLCAYSHEDLFSTFKKHMERFVPVTVQQGNVLKYLNIRIVQTDQGISIDQTHHIRTKILDLWFPPATVERLKSVDTPYRIDSEYEQALNEQLPATEEELAKLEKQHKGSYLSHIGSFLHVQQVTLFAIGFTVTRLAQLAVAPNAAAFEGLKRLARHLTTHLHTPIMYPRRKLKGYQTIRLEVEPGKFVEHLITNLAHLYVDADHARDTRTRKSVSSIMAAIYGVIVHWIMAKQTCVAAHSTDAEIRAYFSGVQLNKYLRCVQTLLRHDMSKPTIIYKG